MDDPRNLGKYRLIAELARGGMGVVYLAVTSGLGGFSKLVVIKELKPELVEDTSFLEMFLEEARLAAHLNHPNVVPTYEVGIEGNRPFIVMEYLDGQTLGRVNRSKVPGFTLEMQLRVITHALDGLQYAHHRELFDGTTVSVVHRDVSPQNIFVTYDGQVKVVDFGIAKASDTTVETRTGVFKGKPSYMSPEQLHGEVDQLADVFAVGVILWEALAGRRMWKRRNDVEVLTLLLKNDIPSIDEVAPNAPAELRRIVNKGVSSDRSARYQSARELREDVDAYLAAVGDRSTLKEIGNVVAQAFESERERLRTIIERCIVESRELAAPREKLPSLAGVDEHGAPSRVSVPPISAYTKSAEEAEVRGYARPPAQETPAGATFEPYPPIAPKGLGVLPFAAAGSLGVAGVVIIVIALTMGRQPRLERVERPIATVIDVPADSIEPAVSVATTATPAASSDEPAPADSGTAGLAQGAPTPAAGSAPSATTTTTTTMRPAWLRAPVKPTPPRPPPPPATASAKLDCNPPFYFEGTKKVFKAGCL